MCIRDRYTPDEVLLNCFNYLRLAELRQVAHDGFFMPLEFRFAYSAVVVIIFAKRKQNIAEEPPYSLFSIS